MIGKSWRNNIVKAALNILHVKKERIYPDFVSKHKPNREKQVILFMISEGEKRKTEPKRRKAKSERRRRLWHYLAVKKNVLLRETTSKHHGDF